MQPSKQPERTALRERNHSSRKPMLAAGNMALGVRPVFLVATALLVAALMWFLYGLLTYPAAAP